MSKSNQLFFLLAMLFFNCSGNKNDATKSTSEPLEDNAYFEAAKAYITYNEQFGVQTDLTSHDYLKIIEFGPSMTGIANDPYNRGNVAKILTVRKSFVINSENTLMMLKRIEASRKDNTTMKVSMHSGTNMSKKFTGNPSDWWEGWEDMRARHKTSELNYCDRIVFNAKGEGVCLNQEGSEVTMSKLSQKYGNRIISSCKDTGAEVSCYGFIRQFSDKILNKSTDELTIPEMRL